MLTTPRVARCHKSVWSSSATATLNWVRRRSFKLRRTCRLSFRECAPSMRSSRVRKAIKFRVSRFQFQAGPNQWSETNNLNLETALGDHFRGDTLRGEGLDDITHLDVAVIGDGDAAFHAVAHLADVIFEAPERADLAFEYHHVVAQQAHFGIALDVAVLHVAAGHRAHLRNAERFAHFRAPLVGLLDGGLEQAAHGLLNLILQLVNDRVQADIHLLLFRQFLRLALRTHVEADDDGVRGGSQ